MHISRAFYIFALLIKSNSKTYRTMNSLEFNQYDLDQANAKAWTEEDERIQELRDKCPSPNGKSLWDCMEYKNKLGREDAEKMEGNFIDAFELGDLLMAIYDPTYLELLDLPCAVSRGQAIFENVDGGKDITIFYDWLFGGKQLCITAINVRYKGDPKKGLSQDAILDALRP